MATNVKSQVAAKPAGNSVTKTYEPKAVQADVDRKMRAYGVYEAFAMGKLPSNKQCNETLTYVLNNSPIDEKKLSKDGKKLINDVREIIHTMQQMVNRKNPNEEIQNFIYHTANVDSSQANATVTAPVSKDQAKEHANEAGRHFRTIGKLIVTNSEFRKLLEDFAVIGRDMLADAAVKTAEIARPDQERLEKVEDPAPSGQFKSTNGTTGTNQSPQITDKTGDDARQASQQAQETKEQGKAHAADVGSSAQNAADRYDDPSAKAGAAGNAATDQVKNKLSGDDARDVEDVRQNFQQSGSNTDAVKNAGQAAKDKLASRIPEEHREKVDEHVDKTKDYLKERFPEERRDKYIYRAKKVIAEVQKHRDFQDAVNFFLQVAEHYGGHVKNQAPQVVGDKADVTKDSSFQTAQSELRKVLENFANGRSMQGIFDAIGDLYDDAQNDDKLKQWFRDIDSYIRKLLKEPGYVLQDKSTSDGKILNKRGHQFFDHKYKGHKDNLFDQIGAFTDGMSEDPLNKKLGQDFKQLWQDIAFNSEGSLSFKPHLFTDIQSVIIPGLAQHITTIPVPRIEYTDPTIDLVVEGLIVQSPNFLPNILTVEAHNHMKFSPRTNIANKHSHEIHVGMSQIQADLRQVQYYIRKKQGFPTLRDMGHADIFIGGSGISVDLTILIDDGMKDSVFHVKHVKANVGTLKWKVKSARHQMLISFAKPFATGLIKKQVAKAIEDGLRGGLEKVNQQLVEARDRYRSAKADPEKSTTDAFKAAAAPPQKATQQAQQKKESLGTFQVVAKRESVLVKDFIPPNSFVDKTKEREQKARVGQDWRSEAFTIIGTTAGTGSGKTPQPTKATK